MADPAAGIQQQMTALLAQMEMKLADAASSGSDFIQTSKEFMASKFFTEPKLHTKDLSNKGLGIGLWYRNLLI